MAVKRTYVGEPGRYYPDFGVTPEPGDTITFANAGQVPDDGRWQDGPAVSPRAAKKTARPRKTAPAVPKPPDDNNPDGASTPATTEES